MGKTQAEMAEAMGMSLTAYGNWERGKTKMTEERLEEFAGISGVTHSDVVDGYEGVDGGAKSMEEYRCREDRFKGLLASANDKIRELEKELESANRLIESQKHSISVLEDIRKMLEKQLSGK